MDLGLQRTVRVVLHHDVRPPGGGGPDLEDADDVRMPGQLAHRHLFAHEPLQVVGLEIRGQHLHRDDAVQSALAAAIHHPESASADLLGISESGSHQLRRDPGVHIPCVGSGSLLAIGHLDINGATAAPWPPDLSINRSAARRWPMNEAGVELL